MARPAALFASRGLRPVGWAMAVLFGAAVFVQLTHAGIDIFLMLVAGFVLLVLERTLGDWIAESVGAPGTVLIFTALAGLAVLYALSPGGRGNANRLFAAAESRGYRPVYFVVEEPAGSAAVKKLAARAGDAATGSLGDLVPTTGKSDGSANGKTDTPAPAAGAQEKAPVSRGILDWSGSGPDKTIRLRLRADPDVIMTGQPVTLRAVIESGERKDGMAALFTVNGNPVASVPFDDSGKALTQFASDVPGLYTARLRVSTGAIFGQEVSATFNVLPGASPRKSR